MPEPSTAAKLVSRDEATTCPEKQITKVIVDPGYDGSFTLDLEKRAAGALKAAPNMRHLDPAHRGKILAELKAMNEGTARRVGQAVATVDGAAHNHPEAEAPSNVLAPPKVRVFFDIPGYASMSFRYHAIKRVPGYLVFITDTRYAGGADFHPFTSKMGGQGGDNPMGAYVENGKKLYLLKPPAILFKHETLEFCLVPIAEERVLPTDDVVQEDLSSELPATEGHADGEERSDRGGDDAPRDPAPPAVAVEDGRLADRIDYSTGGSGGVL